MSRSTSFPDRLRRLRETANLSARHLARLADIAPSHVSLIESAKIDPRVEARTVERLAMVLGTSIDWLYSGRGETPSQETVTAAVARAERLDAKRTGTEG